MIEIARYTASGRRITSTTRYKVSSSGRATKVSSTSSSTTTKTTAPTAITRPRVGGGTITITSDGRVTERNADGVVVTKRRISTKQAQAVVSGQAEMIKSEVQIQQEQKLAQAKAKQEALAKVEADMPITEEPGSQLFKAQFFQQARVKQEVAKADEITEEQAKKLSAQIESETGDALTQIGLLDAIREQKKYDDLSTAGKAKVMAKDFWKSMTAKEKPLPDDAKWYEKPLPSGKMMQGTMQTLTSLQYPKDTGLPKSAQAKLNIVSALSSGTQSLLQPLEHISTLSPKEAAITLGTIATGTSVTYSFITKPLITSTLIVGGSAGAYITTKATKSIIKDTKLTDAEKAFEKQYPSEAKVFQQYQRQTTSKGGIMGIKDFSPYQLIEDFTPFTRVPEVEKSLTKAAELTGFKDDLAKAAIDYGLTERKASLYGSTAGQVTSEIVGELTGYGLITSTLKGRRLKAGFGETFKYTFPLITTAGAAEYISAAVAESAAGFGRFNIAETLKGTAIAAPIAGAVGGLVAGTSVIGRKYTSKSLLTAARIADPLEITGDIPVAGLRKAAGLAFAVPTPSVVTTAKGNVLTNITTKASVPTKSLDVAVPTTTAITAPTPTLTTTFAPVSMPTLSPTPTATPTTIPGLSTITSPTPTSTPTTTTTPVPVVTPAEIKLPPIIIPPGIPGGGGGYADFKFRFPSMRATKYQHSLYQPKKKIKMPSIITGLGVRPMKRFKF